MIQLAWRQFRTQAVVAYGLLAVIAVVLVITGVQLVHYYDSYVATCGAHGDCSPAQTAFLARDHIVQAALGPVLLVLPALIGMFWGAPLIARELETGTFRLAWTQSMTRGRWLTVKLVMLGLASMAVTGLLSLAVTWWFSRMDQLNLNRFTPGVFEDRGIVPIGYAAFAFALGVAAGVLIRRTVPAMAATLLPYAGARLAVAFWVRPHLMTPLRSTAPLSLGGPGKGTPNPSDWLLSSQTLNRAGQVIGQNGGIIVGHNMQEISFQPRPGGVWLAGAGRCPNIPAGTTMGRGSPVGRSGALQTCIDKLGVHQQLVYQPISRYWAFQGYETGIFLAAAAVLAGFCLWWVRRRLT
ncbi:MAG TPA: ABC transporter permease [Streptosporangiaceae bacterium]|jgi:hypothetical protein